MKLHHSAPLGAPKPMKMQHAAPFEAANPMKIHHAAPMGLPLGWQTLWEYSMRSPWGLPFLHNVAFSSELHWRGGANPTPSRSPSSRSKCAPTAAASLQQKANATAMRIRVSEKPHGESQRRTPTGTHGNAAPAAAQRRNSTPKAKTEPMGTLRQRQRNGVTQRRRRQTDGSLTRRARAPTVGYRNPFECCASGSPTA